MSLNKQNLFIVFKYTVYLLLTFNVWVFYQEEALASQEVFSSGLTLENIIKAYSSTIDTAAWVVLILLFELETAVIPDEKLKGALKWWLMGIRSVCYAVIVYAFVGYMSKYLFFINIEAVQFDDVCTLIGQGYTYIADLDEYFPLTVEICKELNNQPLFQLPGTQIIGSADAVLAAKYLALTDVINSGTWILVVVLLEIEVLLQIRRELSRHLLRLLSYSKTVLYSLLLLCAVYWGIKGDFIDFWDAFLWLVAFVFIELNIFNWNRETSADNTL